MDLKARVAEILKDTRTEEYKQVVNLLQDWAEALSDYTHHKIKVLPAQSCGWPPDRTVIRLQLTDSKDSYFTNLIDFTLYNGFEKVYPLEIIVYDPSFESQKNTISSYEELSDALFQILKIPAVKNYLNGLKLIRE